jgi:chromosome segregation ATPase
MQDALPMVQQLEFNPIFKPAIMQVFGKTLICRDMDKASQFAKSSDMDSITLEGDIDIPAWVGGWVGGDHSIVTSTHTP